MGIWSLQKEGVPEVGYNKLKLRTIHKYILSKLLYETEKFGIWDLILLFELQIDLEDKIERGEFKTEFQEKIKDLSKTMKEFNFSNNLSDQGILRFVEKIKNLDSKNELTVPRRNYSSLKVQSEKEIRFRVISPKELFSSRPKPPKAYIGKGYTDKGNRRDLAITGSPSWQEVSSHRGRLYPIPGDRDYEN